MSRLLIIWESPIQHLKNGKNKYPAISATLKKGKEVVDTEVENALLQKALGMTKTIQKPIKLKEVLYDNGKRTSEKEHIEFVEEEIFIPPDTTAQIFWLKNRRPDKWRDKQKDEVDTTALVKLDNILQEIKDDAERSNKQCRTRLNRKNILQMQIIVGILKAALFVLARALLMSQLLFL